MKTILQPTKEELKKAEEKFNRLRNRFFTALSILHDTIPSTIIPTVVITNIFSPIINTVKLTI